MKKFTFLILYLIFSCVCLNAQQNAKAQPGDTWTQKANCGGGTRSIAIGFSIGSKAYIGTGAGAGLLMDFWEWDQNTNVWTQKADFGGGGRIGATGFSIGTKGYTGTGAVQNGETKQFWEWDQATNIWMQKADFGGTARTRAVGFSIGNKGYVGTDGNTGNDFWEWDQATDIWKQKADLPGPHRAGAIGFSIGTKAYIGTGYDSTGVKNDFWEWDQATDTWTQKANFPGTPRAAAVGFSIGTKGYIGMGGDANNTIYYQDFWEWDQATNIWTQLANFGGAARIAAVGFSIGNNGYIGTGTEVVGAMQDFWEYSPLLSGINELGDSSSLSVFPNPANNTITINFTSPVIDVLTVTIKNELGAIVYSESKKDFSGTYINTIDLSKQPKGIYFIEIMYGGQKQSKKIVLQ